MYRGIVAALLPALAAGIGLWVLFAVFGLPVVGGLAAFTLGTLIILSDLGLLVGAAIGGAIADRGTKAVL